MQKISKTLQKGFTIIELIVVIAVLGVLVLLALPKFLDYTEKAKIAQIKSEIVAKEKFIDSKRVQNDDYIKDWEEVDVATMESLKKSLFNKRGLITDSNNVEFKGKYYNVPKNSELEKMSLKMKTSSLLAKSLKGDFYLGQGGEVYYYDENLANKILGKDESGNGNNGNGGNDGGNGDGDGQPPVTEPKPDLPGPFKVTFKDYYGQTIEEKTVEKGKSVDPPSVEIKGYEFSGWDKDLTNITSDIITKAQFSKGPTDKDLGYSDSDFEWRPSDYGSVREDGEKGCFRYRGNSRETVEIPHVIQGVKVTSYCEMFLYHGSDGYARVEKVISTNKNVTNMRYMFNYSGMGTLDVSLLDTSNVTDMKGMFNSSEARTLDVSNFDTSNVTDMSLMFAFSKATQFDLSNFDTSNVTDMSWMFANIRMYSFDISSFNTSKVTNMNHMFSGSSTLTRNLDLSHFDTSNVTNMSWMFSGFDLASETNINVSKFNTSKVTDMSYMFATTSAKNLDLRHFDTSNVTNMSNMFSGSHATTLDLNNTNSTTLDLSSFNTSNVTDMSSMFESLWTKNVIVTSFNTSNVTTMEKMFYKLHEDQEVLDLSSFDTTTPRSNGFGVNTSDMFYDKAPRILKGYAKDEANAKNLNSVIAWNAKIFSAKQ